MKKVFLAIMAMTMLVATSCKKESINAPENLNPGKGEFLVTIANGIKSNAPAAKGDMSTKTTIDVNNIIWTQDDVISINGKRYKTFTSGKEVIFSPEAEDQRVGEGETTFNAYYPFDLMTAGLPSTFEYNGGDLKNLPMYATSTDHTLAFSNICAAIKIKVPVACNKIVISANENIAGNITISYDNDKDKYKAVLGSTGASNTITITNENGFSQPNVFTDSLVYVAIPDGTYNNFTIKLYGEGDVLCGDRTISKPLTLNVNNLYNLTFNTSAPLDVPLDAFCFTALENGEINYITSVAIGKELFEYRIDTESSWTAFTKNQGVSLGKSHKMYVRARNTIVNIDPTMSNKFSSSMNVNVSGNIMYLLDPNATEQSDLTSANQSAFKSLFNGMTTLVDASKLILPNNIASSCYYTMFLNCSNLVAAPTLPATTLESSCYWQMFQGCSSLESVTMLATSVSSGNDLYNWLSSAGTNTGINHTLTISKTITDLSSGTGETISKTVPKHWTIKNDDYTWTHNGSSWVRQNNNPDPD